MNMGKYIVVLVVFIIGISIIIYWMYKAKPINERQDKAYDEIDFNNKSGLLRVYKGKSGYIAVDRQDKIIWTYPLIAHLENSIRTEKEIIEMDFVEYCSVSEDDDFWIAATGHVRQPDRIIGIGNTIMEAIIEMDFYKTYKIYNFIK